MTPLTSTSVRASWQLPPADSTYGIILGFKLLYRNKSSAADPLTVMTIRSNSTLDKEVTGLGKYTEYEFQVLAFSSVGNGPRSVQLVTTNEDGKLKRIQVYRNIIPFCDWPKVVAKKVIMNIIIKKKRNKKQKRITKKNKGCKGHDLIAINLRGEGTSLIIRKIRKKLI